MRDAEEEALETKRRVQAEARSIVREAERQAAEKLAQSVSKAEAEGRELVVAAEKEAQKEVVPIRLRAEEDIDRIREKAGVKQEEAVTMVMERIVKTDGHS